ncbi:hypothetical protein FQR65_LT04952 [Abscondita terminalis]|nr:hypothetical protein FQR65_LT04952 [Abscondita terminalis]
MNEAKKVYNKSRKFYFPNKFACKTLPKKRKKGNKWIDLESSFKCSKSESNEINQIIDDAFNEDNIYETEHSTNTSDQAGDESPILKYTKTDWNRKSPTIKNKSKRDLIQDTISSASQLPEIEAHEESIELNVIEEFLTQDCITIEEDSQIQALQNKNCYIKPKKKSFAKNGLAYSLQRALWRRNAEVCFWEHQIEKEPCALFVQIKNVYKQFGVRILECKDLNELEDCLIMLGSSNVDQFLTNTVIKIYEPFLNKIVNVRQLTKYVEKPKTGFGTAYRRIIHYPEEYTVKPLEVTNLAGRDPVSGRVVCKGIGGGIKHKYHWISWIREGPKEGPPQAEKVIKIIHDGCRTAYVALVAVGDKLKYILATENMKAGDIIHTSCHIPRIPVRPQEGDAYPLGALPLGTQVHCVEKYPGLGGFLVHAAGTYATIIRKAPNNHVVVQMPSRLSNKDHSSTPIGSAQRSRELGNRPRSGWWQKKTGRFGRKIRRLPPVRTFVARDVQHPEVVQLTLDKFTRGTQI